MTADARAGLLVTGSTGKAGAELCRALAERGHAYRAGVRRAAAPGEVALDFTDPATWDAALSGIRGLFLMRPPAIADIAATLAPFIDAARAAGVRHIVFMSVAGAERNRFLPHAAVERHLMAGPTDWTILRPGFFAQNLDDAYLRDIREDDRLYIPAGRGRVAFLDLHDLGDVAARCMTAPSGHLGRAYHLTGPEAVGFAAVAAALSRVTGRTIAYRPASVLGYIRHLRRRGAPPALIAIQTYLHVGLRFGQAEAVSGDVARLLGRPARDVFDHVAEAADLWTAGPP